MSRRPSPPPELPGFTYVEPLGTGGFADVFLYEQEMPRRRVAVKVLLADRISSGAAQEFADEANVMAMLSTHPAIVTIYQAGVAGDGRPYLVMEYCPRPNLQMRSRKEPFSVAEALRVGIQVAGAVETAHRAGVLHRDIKPANILVTEYNRPALTDFGIASTTGATGESSGMSIPWSPPESFAEPPQSGPRTDVWALGATLYTLLAGRSPFERPGERNSSADLIERIERAALPSLARPDSPESLQRLLERAMAKNPDDRFPSAVAFARALQKIQIELSHSVTPIDIVDDHPPAEDLEDDNDGLTRVREIVSIDPGMSSTSTRPSAATQPKGPAVVVPDAPRFTLPARVDDAVEQTQRRGAGVASAAAAPAPPTAPSAPAGPGPDRDDRTILRPPQVVHPESAPAPTPAPAPVVEAPSAAPSADADSPAPPRSRRGLWIGLAAAAVVIVVGGIVGLNLLVAGLAPEPAPETTEAAVDPQNPVSDAVPKVTQLTGTRSGAEVTFTWQNPDPQEGDSYIWTETGGASDGAVSQAAEATVTFTPASPGEVCVEVMLRRGDGRASEPARGCVE
ncbi:serine/threonine-protein kinase [Microbacterium sp. BLY]|uniref:serine/threonine-protein kinase n=1 Tax=Microbacterium sp. BLY TaxID=2823280 RepID=UPI001B31C2B4|nr:serine/threonine-protein kinase [Microbacterium sp. BLY]MBP3977325.1 serine/threonine protein kinase [Microbacterium sp. BLY]